MAMPKKESIIRTVRRSRCIDVHTHVGIDPAGFLNGNAPYCLSAEDLLLRMRQTKVDHAVTFPFLYTSYFALDAFRQGRFIRSRHNTSRFPFEAENRLLLQEIYELSPECAGTLLPFMFFDPARKPNEQAAHIRTLAHEYPIFGLKTATTYLQSHGTALLKKGRVLLDCAVELDLPVMLHTSVHPDDVWANVHDLLDIAEARQDVRFCMAHTCRFDRDALQRADALPNCFIDCSALHIHCQLARENSSVVAPKQKRFSADYRSPAKCLKALATAFPNSFLWGTDTPFHQYHGSFYDSAGTRHTLHLTCRPDDEIRALRQLPPALQKAISSQTSQRFLFGTD